MKRRVVRGLRVACLPRWLLTTALLIPSTGVAQAVIVGDDGRSTITYDCTNPATQLKSAAGTRVVQDYTIRMARASVQRKDTARLHSLMALYESADWPALERVIVARVCGGEVLPPPVLPFPSPGSSSLPLEFIRVRGSDTLGLADLKGKPVVVNFWATWCRPCVAELPGLARFAAEFADGVVVVAVAYKDSPDRVARWLDRHPPGNVVYVLDPDGAAAETFDVFAVPATFVLDDQGRVEVSGSNPYNRMKLPEFGEKLRRASNQRP